jgi:ELWxxDGT repeat protein
LALLASLLLPTSAFSQRAKMVTDINPFLDNYSRGVGSYPGDLTVYDNALYFRANDGVHGNELWKWDGNSAVMVQDILDGSASSGPSDFIVFDDALYFTASHDDSYFARDLWKLQDDQLTRLTTPDQVNLKIEGYNPHAAIVDDQLVFVGRKVSRISTTIELNGESKEIDVTVSEWELWNWDGSEVAQVTDLYSQFLTPPYSGPPINSLHNFKDSLYFTVSGDMWVWDGESASTVTDLQAISWPRELTAINGNLFFSGEFDDIGRELCIWNGVDPPTILDLRPGSASSYPREFVQYGDDVYFAAYDGIPGHELWKWDGTEAQPVVDIWPGGEAFNIKFMTVFDNALYFAASTDEYGRELWKWDGEQASMVTNVESLNLSNRPLNHLTEFDNALYFSHTDAEHGTELWRLQAIPEPSDALLALLGSIAMTQCGRATRNRW